MRLLLDCQNAEIWKSWTMNNFDRIARFIQAAIGRISPLLIGCLALSQIGTQLHASPIAWYVQNATLGNGGVLTGSFVYDASTNALTNLNLTITQDGTIPPVTWDNATATPGAGYVFATEMQFVTGYPTTGAYGITLDFESALGASGGTVDLIAPNASLIAYLSTSGGSVDLFQSGEVTTQVATLIGFQGGSSSDPVLLPGGEPVAQVTGTIGASGSQEYYTFNWSGGAFSATASISDNPALNTGASYLFSEGDSCGGGGGVTLDSNDSFTNTIAIGNLLPGQYCIGIDANNPNDPAFAMTFNTPVAGAPEPSGVVFLLFIGLGTISVLRGARRERGHS